MPSKSYHLVHANISIARDVLCHPIIKGFVELADEIDEIAWNTPGFVSQPTPPDADSIYQHPELLNLSVWESIESLQNFVYSGKHKTALDHREEWFVQGEKYNYILYWEEAGVISMESETRNPGI
jgi:hypothetical protein